MYATKPNRKRLPSRAEETQSWSMLLLTVAPLLAVSATPARRSSFARMALPSFVAPEKVAEISEPAAVNAIAGMQYVQLELPAPAAMWVHYRLL